MRSALNTKSVSAIFVVTVFLLGITAAAVPVSAQQPVRGCQAEGADYLIDIKAMEGVPYPDDLEGLSFPFPWTVILAFGPCCVTGYYEGPQNNGFPAGCCHPPNFPPPYAMPEHFCKCDWGLHRTPSSRLYGSLPTTPYTDPATGLDYIVLAVIPFSELPPMPGPPLPPLEAWFVVLLPLLGP